MKSSINHAPRDYVRPTTDDRPARISVAGQKPRPIGFDVVSMRLWAVRSPRTREILAVHLAEISYECFMAEHLFRELLDRERGDLDGILASLIDFEIQLEHIADQVRANGRFLKTGIRQVDAALSRASRAIRKKRER